MSLKDQSNEEIAESQKEAQILEKLKHPNIIKFEEVIMDYKKRLMYIIMEYANGKWATDFDKLT